MSGAYVRLATVTSLALVTATGCHEVKWEDWQFVKIEEHPRQSQLSFRSAPKGAAVLLDGARIGWTPCDAEVGYTETAAIFERKQIETKGFEKRVIDTQKQRRNVTENPSAHTVRFSRPHYSDAFEAFVVPGAARIDVELNPVPYREEFKKIDRDLKRSQRLRLLSNPQGAAVFHEGEKLGVTPFARTFDYSESELVFETMIIEERTGPSPHIRIDSRRERGGVLPGVYNLVFKREGFLDASVVLTTPSTDSEFTVDLLPSAEIIDIPCTLKITARLDYYDQIEGLITDYVVPNRAGRRVVDRNPADEPKPVAGSLDAYRRTYTFLVKDTDTFERMVAELKLLKSRNQWKFEFTYATLEAGFDTNVMLSDIVHTVRAQVRPKSYLFYVEGATSSLRPVVPRSDDGMYQFNVTLRRDQTDVVLVSLFDPPDNRYALPIAVFMKVDVHSQRATEISRETFEEATRLQLSDELIEELARSLNADG